MSDIWSGLGVELNTGDGEWLYRQGSEVRGPIPFKSVVNKLLTGEIDLNTPVAKEGGDFHPLVRVKAFEPHLADAKKVAQKKAARKVRSFVALLALPVVVALAAGGYFFWQDYQHKLALQAKVEKERLEKEAAEKQRLANLPKMELVALVSLGTEQDVKIHSNKKVSKGGGKKPSGSVEGPEPEEMVQSCKLTQNDIFGTMSKNLRLLNVCVEDEKSRDTQGLLPPTLELSFVVKPDGKVVDFEIGNRHYRKGPLNNCMIKAFSSIRFPSTTGTNCPVTIPIKIGG